MNGKRWLPEHTDILRRMNAVGYTDGEIAAITGHKRETVTRRRIIAGIEAACRRRPKFPFEKIAFSLRERFERNQKKDIGSDCILWTGTRDARGYGLIGTRGVWAKKAHQLAWEYANGPIPTGLMICHTCDTPACVNPEHLYAGTAADNGRDMKLRKRCRNQWSVIRS